MKIINYARAYVKELNNDAVMLRYVDCAGTAFAGAAYIQFDNQDYHTVVVCRWVDSSNFCVILPPSGLDNVVEVLATGGDITIFPQTAAFTQGTFLDGSSSVSTSGGVKFRAVPQDASGGSYKWARLG